MNATGGYVASVPLDLPTPRGGLPLPVQIVSGGHGVGAAGLGWDVPLSYVRVDASIAKRKPKNAPNTPAQGRQRVSVSLAGQSLTLVPKGNLWVSQEDSALFTATPSGASWLVYDGQGHTYSFTEPAGHTGIGLWLLTSVTGPGGTMMTLAYDVQIVALTGGDAMSVDLVRVTYNFHPTMGCGKDVVDLAYGTASSTPLSISVTPVVTVRMHTLSSVTVQSRSTCASATTVRGYALTYAPDLDTQLPRLQSVTMTGRDGTPEAATTLPVAAYHYGSASSAGALTFTQTTSFSIPTASGLDPTQITGSVTSSISTPGSGQAYATLQSMTDVTGDGRADLVFSNGGTLWVAKNAPTAAGTTALAAPTVLGDSSLVMTGPVSDSKLTTNRFGQDLDANKENVWKQQIDINGDGRVDLIDAGHTAGQWTVYLNTPGTGASGVVWQERVIPITSIMSRLATYGHTFNDPDHLPLARRFTAKEYTTHATGDVDVRLAEITYTEWELKDVNGDGLPDFAFNTVPVQMQSIPFIGDFGEQEVDHVPAPGPGANSIAALFNVGAITLDSQGATPYREVFSDPSILLGNTACGLEMWKSDFAANVFETGQLLRCALVDVTGDGIVDRVDREIVGSVYQERAFLGLGSAFSPIQIPLPMDFIGWQDSRQRDQCPGAPGSSSFQSVVWSGLRDVTGDGIADLLLGNPGHPMTAYVGTGFGFRTTPLTVTGMDNLSTQTETCDGASSRTTDGLFDVDGDGRPEFVHAGGTSYWVKTLAGGSAPGIPEAGQLTAIDNGYGATTLITYRSAKQDVSTPHAVPFSEIVVASVRTMRATETANDALAATTYAYGNASLVYDPIAAAFVFPGYGRTVSLRALEPGDKANGQTTITDTLGLAAYVGGAHADRFARQAAVGRTSAVSILSGPLGGDPWALLTIDAVNDGRQTSRTTYEYSSRLFEEPAGVDEALLDCVEFPDPYDYDGSLGQALLGYDVCSAHGFMFTATTATIRGAPPPSTSNVQTRTRVVAVDDYGRATSVGYDNDLYRSDDDLCVDTTYAAPTGAGAPVLIAPATRRLSGCAKNNVTYGYDTWEYDDLPAGSVSTAFVTSHTVERHATDTGAMVRSVRVYDGTYDAIGNLVSTISVRDDGAYRETTYAYDPFGLVVVSTTTTGTNVPSLTSTTAVDAVTLDPLFSTDPNGTKRGVTYDGFQRVTTTSVTPPAGAVGILSTTTYSGFGEGSSGRQVAVTQFDDPVPPSELGSVAGHTVTTVLDELGRRLRNESTLGADYGGQILITDYRTYDVLGRPAFEAEPFVSTDSPATAYGTSRYFQPDGTPNCFVRAKGPHALTAISDDATETFPTCFYHGYSNHLETFGVSEADANLPGSPQSGVLKIETVTGIGRLLSRSTSGSGQVLEYATFTEDRLGNLTAETRYKAPSTPAYPVTSTWRYDSAGNVLQQQDPEGAAAINTFDNWGELTQVAWSDPATSPPTDRRIVTAYDALGRVVHREERNGGVVNPETVNDFQYDVGQQVSPEVQPTYVLGRLAKASAPSGQSYYSYDEYGATNATTWVDESGTRYVETDERRKDGTTLSTNLYLPDAGYDAERVDYGYDSANRVAAVVYAGPSGTLTLYKASSVDPLGRVLRATYGAGTTYEAEYSSAGRRLLLRATATTTSGSRDFRFDSYDPVGRELSRLENQNGTDERHTWETYDALGRLSTSNQVRGTSTTARWQYAYDPLGNITSSYNSVSASATSLSSRTIDQDEACRIGYPTPSGSGCNVTHDFSGNVVEMPTRTGSRRLSYFLSGQVKAIRDNQSMAKFRYDPFGAVQELDLTGTTSDNRRDRHYGSLVEVRNQTVGGVTSSFISRSIPGPGGMVASLRGMSPGSWVFSFGEARGLRFTTDRNGNFLQDVAYQPFGEATSIGQSPGSPLYSTDQWNGGDALAAFGLSHLGARLYDPVIGRFLSRDPLTIARTASTSNPYAFAANDPVNHSDPTGLDWGGGCIGIECQGLDWHLPFVPGGAGGGGGGGTWPGLGGNPGAAPAPPPPALPPGWGQWWQDPYYYGPDGSAWPKFQTASLGSQFKSGWMRTMGRVDRGLHAAVNFVDEHSREFVAGGVFVAAMVLDPPALVADLITTTGAGFGALFSEEEPAVVEATAAGAEEATTLEQVMVTARAAGADGVAGGGEAATAEAASADVTRVSRWMTEAEADNWTNRSSMPQPGAASGTPPRTFVTAYGAPKPGGTGPVRVDFNVATQALQGAGRADWYTIFNESLGVPVHDVTIVRP